MGSTNVRPRGRRTLTSSAVRTAVFGASIAVLFLLPSSNPAAQAGAVIDVPAGGSLQQALNAVQPGGTIRLAAGATYIGTFTLPAKGGSQYILITTATTLPPAGVRIDPSYKPRLATIRSSTTSAALSTAAGASYYRIVGVAFEANKNGSGDIIALGRADQTTLTSIPHDIEFDRVLISGDPTIGQKRAIAANAINVSVLNSDIRDIKAVGQDSQAIAAWNSPGPFLIRNNFLEAAGENILFGGADIMVAGVIPSDITVEDNVLTKNPAWRGGSWTVKNILELKNARRVVVRRNRMYLNWGGSQTGFAIVLTPRNSSGRTPWVEVSDVEFSGNIVAHSGSAFNLLGHDDTDISGQLARVVLRNNLVYDIDGDAWEGNGIFAQIGGEPIGITIDHNTILHTGNVVTFYPGQYPNGTGATVTGGPIFGFRFTNNLVQHNAYGIFGTGQSYGNGTLAYYTPGALVQRNVLATNSSVASRYPSDNLFPSVAAFNATFRNALGRDYRLAAGSPYVGAGTDGRNIGSDFTTLPAPLPTPFAPAGLRITSR